MSAAILVRPVGAILVAIAHGRVRYASARFHAPELRTVDSVGRRVAVLLVLGRRTIRFSVANPRIPDAVA